VLDRVTPPVDVLVPSTARTTVPSVVPAKVPKFMFAALVILIGAMISAVVEAVPVACAPTFIEMQSSANVKIRGYFFMIKKFRFRIK
jgi:hypothetical protein